MDILGVMELLIIQEVCIHRNQQTGSFSLSICWNMDVSAT